MFGLVWLFTRVEDLHMWRTTQTSHSWAVGGKLMSGKEWSALNWRSLDGGGGCVCVWRKGKGGETACTWVVQTTELESYCQAASTTFSALWWPCALERSCSGPPPWRGCQLGRMEVSWVLAVFLPAGFVPLEMGWKDFLKYSNLLSLMPLSEVDADTSECGMWRGESFAHEKWTVQ